jgi:hypothetical protein
MIPDVLTIAVWAAERHSLESSWTYVDLAIDWEAYELPRDTPVRFCAEVWAYVGTRFWGGVPACDHEALP